MTPTSRTQSLRSVIVMQAERCSYYLTDEAAERRLAKLVDRIAREGLRPGESVPDHITVMADFRRGELRAAA
jgi:hypothetical protein